MKESLQNNRHGQPYTSMHTELPPRPSVPEMVAAFNSLGQRSERNFIPTSQPQLSPAPRFLTFEEIFPADTSAEISLLSYGLNPGTSFFPPPQEEAENVGTIEDFVKNNYGTRALRILSDPHTKKLFEDPVLTPRGLTFEKSFLEQRFQKGENTYPGTKRPLYQRELRPNLVIRNIVDLLKEKYKEGQEFPELSSQRKAFTDVDELVIERYGDTLQDNLSDPITKELFHHPVTTRQGLTYEKKAIETWINKGNHTCPMTRSDLLKSDLVPNTSVQDITTLLRKEFKDENKATTRERRNERIKNLFSCFSHHSKEQPVVGQHTQRIVTEQTSRHQGRS